MKAFFCSKGKFCPPYFWITVFLLVVLVMFTLRLFSIGNFSDGIILGVLAFVEIWILLYDHNKRKNNGV